MKGKFLWLIILWLLCCGAIIYFLCGQINNIIQAIAIITLVFVTLYYAVQTQKLVEEGKKKRDADFYEKRIDEFYMPFIEKLNVLKDKIHESPLNSVEMHNLSRETVLFLWQKARLAPKKTIKKIKALLIDLLVARPKLDENTLEKLRESEDEVRKIIVEEWKIVEDEIRKIYGYFEPET